MFKRKKLNKYRKLIWFKSTKFLQKISQLWSFKFSLLSLIDILYLVGGPHSSSLSNPFSGVDTSVNPDSRTIVTTGAELNTNTDSDMVLHFASKGAVNHD